MSTCVPAGHDSKVWGISCKEGGGAVGFGICVLAGRYGAGGGGFGAVETVAAAAGRQKENALKIRAFRLV